jgi:hypothetical protein
MNQLVNYITVDFVCAGKPILPAKSGVRALDIQANKLYLQTAMPFGAGWVEQTGTYYLSASTGGSGVLTVTGLDTDNTDPANPIVQIAVDGVTITGDGTPGNPLVGATAGVPTTRKVDTTAPLTGGGDLSADRTIAIPQATALVDGYLSSADWAAFDAKQNALGFTPEDVANKATDLTAPDNTKYPTTLAVSNALANVSINKIMAYIAAKR